MDPSQSFNQPPGALNLSEKSVMLQPAAVPPPPVYQDNTAGNPPSFPSQPVPQVSFAQGSYPGQSVVVVQPAVPAAPLVNPMPEHTCCSIFIMFCCCLPLGTAALVYSLFTRIANYSGQRELAERNSKTACILNHVGLAIGICFIVLFLILHSVKNTYQ